MSSKLIGYARVSTNTQDHERQTADLLAAGVRKDDLYVDHGVSGAKAKRPGLDRAMEALQEGDTLVITTLDRLGRQTEDMLTLSRELRERGVNLKVLNLGGEAVDTRTPMGTLLFTIMAGLAQMELEVKRERNRDSVAKRRAQGKSLGGRPQACTDDRIRYAQQQIESGETAVSVARELGVSTSTLYRRMAALAG